MATVSSHILDSVVGDHARGIRVQLFRLSESADKEPVFDTHADQDGRIAEEVNVDRSSEYELVFHSAAYFARRADYCNPLPADGRQIIRVVVVRLTLPDAATKYHLPLVLSPHSYTIWWSG